MIRVDGTLRCVDIGRIVHLAGEDQRGAPAANICACGTTAAGIEDGGVDAVSHRSNRAAVPKSAKAAARNRAASASLINRRDIGALRSRASSAASSAAFAPHQSRRAGRARLTA